MIALLILSLFTTNAFADATAGAGASADAGAVATSGIGVGIGGGGGGGGGGGSASSTAGLNQLNAIDTQAGASGNITNTSLTLGGTTIPANTKADNTIHQEVSGTQTLKNVPSMGAPGLTTTLTETCMGSSSGGLVVAGFGGSLGSTWTDKECVNRLNAREVRTLGSDGALAAKEIMCSNEVVRLAYRHIGKPCYGDTEIVSSTQAKEEKASFFSSNNGTQGSNRGHPARSVQWFE